MLPFNILLIHLRSSRWPKYLDTYTHVGKLDGVSGSWLQPCPALGIIRHVGGEPADGGSPSISHTLSLCLTNNQLIKLFKNSKEIILIFNQYFAEWHSGILGMAGWCLTGNALVLQRKHMKSLLQFHIKIIILWNATQDQHPTLSASLCSNYSTSNPISFLCIRGKPQKMVHVLGPHPRVRSRWRSRLAPAFGLVYPWLLWQFGSEREGRRFLCHSFFLCNFSFQS